MVSTKILSSKTTEPHKTCGQIYIVYGYIYMVFQSY